VLGSKENESAFIMKGVGGAGEDWGKEEENTVEDTVLDMRRENKTSRSDSGQLVL
jgi:hypothetical protein